MTIFITIYKRLVISCFTVIVLVALKIINTDKNSFYHKIVPNSELLSFVLWFFFIVTHAEIQGSRDFIKADISTGQTVDFSAVPTFSIPTTFFDHARLQEY